jgi:putative addiction module killer protein
MYQATLTDVSLDPILDQLTQLAQLELDWDSYGALAVSPVAFVKACQLLIHVKYSLSSLVGDLMLPYDAAPIAKRLRRVELGNLGDYRSLGAGVYELKIDYGPGYRIYFGQIGLTVVLLLCGGDKSSQDQDISQAKKYWRDYERTQSANK